MDIDFTKVFKYKYSHCEDNVYTCSPIKYRAKSIEVSWEHEYGGKYILSINELKESLEDGTCEFIEYEHPITRETPAVAFKFTVKDSEGVHTCYPVDSNGECQILWDSCLKTVPWPADVVQRRICSGYWIALPSSPENTDQSEELPTSGNLLDEIKSFVDKTNCFVSVEANGYQLVAEDYAEYFADTDERLIEIMNAILVLNGE